MKELHTHSGILEALSIPFECFYVETNLQIQEWNLISLTIHHRQNRMFNHYLTFVYVLKLCMIILDIILEEGVKANFFYYLYLSHVNKHFL